MARQSTGRELSHAKKMEVIRCLHTLSTKGKLARGAILTTASEHEIHRTTVSRIWKAFQRNELLPSLKAGHAGRLPVYTPHLVASTVRELPQLLRSTICGEALDKVFLTLQAVMRLVLENNGGTHFRLPHLRKDALRRAKALMPNVSCSASLLG
ncbi:hypothetical protein B5M09_006669 [Aphanomyces astaci]|uniref:DUF7769 domain-containing protein n=1 Tax=Aphanomyces astaci TaxID=112090 RepID=A0A3R7W7U8_APHAT|nr:hypothetical protein B5M09_006669 [Aphanomyces astaci]